MNSRTIILSAVLLGIVIISGCISQQKVCTQDAKQCPDGSYVSRDPNNNCNFFPCAEEASCSSPSGGNMSLDEAREIAKSGCPEGNLTGNVACNNYTGTWWLDLNITRTGCAPACVVNVTSKTAEINWRCTGLGQPTV